MFFKKEADKPYRPFGVVLGWPLYETPPEFTPWQDFKMVIWVISGPLLLLLSLVMIIYGLLGAL